MIDIEKYAKAINEIRGYATLISEDAGGTVNGARALHILMNVSTIEELIEKLYDEDLAYGVSVMKAEGTE